MLNSHWPWITPSKWRQSTQIYDSSSREAPSAIQSVAEEDEDVVEVHPNDVRTRESKYDVKPLVLSDNDEDHTPVGTSPTSPRSPRRSAPVGVKSSAATVESECVKIDKLYDMLSTLKPSPPTHSVHDARKNLPKIEYSKLVNLSLTNLDEYMVCIYNLGYSRMWPTKFAQPTNKDLEEVWRGEVEGDNVRREAYLVLLNTIPSSLKYLVRNVQSGDVLGIWKAILDRLLHTTPDKKRSLINDWNMLSMNGLKMPLDKFVAHLYVKADTLKRYGVEISEEEMVQVFIAGLTKDYDWFRCHQRMSATSLSMAQATKICVDYAYDNDLMSFKESRPILHVADASGNSKAKAICRNFNSEKGCSRTPCAYKHEKLPAAGGNQKASSSVERKCWSCQSTKHMLDKCPKKDEYIKKRDKRKAAATVSGAVHLNMVLPIFATLLEDSKPWILDGAASKHITTDEVDYHGKAKELNGSVVFTVGNDQTMVPTHVGNVKFGNITLSEVYLCKECPVKLISESQLI